MVAHTARSHTQWQFRARAPRPMRVADTEGCITVTVPSGHDHHLAINVATRVRVPGAPVADRLHEPSFMPVSTEILEDTVDVLRAHIAGFDWPQGSGGEGRAYLRVMVLVRGPAARRLRA